tara:strand:- start:1014 stop:1235 length:222 start_codon:yes stop_codon:yes gene_type:complete
MKKIRKDSESASDYNNRVQKNKYHCDIEYKYKIKLNYYKKKFDTNESFQKIFKNQNLSNCQKFKQVKLLCIDF